MSSTLINALKNPALYNHSIDEFYVLETHISWVILTGLYAYKIKKPVNFGFLDFSTLEKRKHFCEQELLLNRRLAPELYLEVTPIFGTEAKPSLNNAADAPLDSPIIEYAVKMSQFPSGFLLSSLSDKQVLTSEHIHQLAETISTFHQSIAIAPANSQYGTATSVLFPVKENFEQIESRLNNPDLLNELRRIKEWADSSFQRLRPLIEKRKLRGFTRECHGDLHLGNITLYNEELVIFDCIEFNPSLTWVDVISDLAFLVMDLENKNNSTFANQLINQYLEYTGDYEGVALLPFYKAYRAMVRAKVAILSLDLTNKKENISKNKLLMQDYRQYVSLADKYEAIPSRYILLMHGYSGSGKSVISGQLVEELGAIRIRSDVERKRLFNYNAKEQTKSPIEGGIYTEEATKKTYDRVTDLTHDLLNSGASVIVDAAHLKRWQRELLLQTAESQAVPLLIISCYTEYEDLKERVTMRSLVNINDKNRDASEATIQVLEQQHLMADKLSNDELDYTITVHTGQPDQLSKLVNQIKHHVGI